MKIAIVTGSLGLIGFEAVKFFLRINFFVIGFDNNLRKRIYQVETNYQKKLNFLKEKYSERYLHFGADIRDSPFLDKIFKEHSHKIRLILHTAAQTSHDWSAKDPVFDFSINALSTIRLLELYRHYSPKAVFIFTSTNKVYGDRVNSLSFREYKKRYDLLKSDKYYQGINEDFPIDQSLHSPFGVSKSAADLMVQEYGKYFGLRTGVFRLGVVSGVGQNGSHEQGFLSFLIKKLIKKEEFRIIGYQGKQVRDIIDARDVVSAFYYYYHQPKQGEIYNLGGGRENSLSILELIDQIKILTGERIKITYQPYHRLGDHKWWITDYSKFRNDFPNWQINFNVKKIIQDIYLNEKSGQIQNN
ncbi:MAG: NAD-dependent epimerase/dehydratase family protein [Patescibacteria group bacterium]|nr:NAD-dependent epimerase/dehydratase family protein [Patescibacteria group bacterium]